MADMSEEQQRAAARQRQLKLRMQLQADSGEAPAVQSDTGYAAVMGMPRDAFSNQSGADNGATALDPVVGDPTGVSDALEVAGDNIIGYDNGVMSPGEKLGTALNVGGEGLTFGLVGDEAAAAADSMIGRGGSYEENLSRYRGDEAQFRQENPVLAFGAEVAPALIPGVGIANASLRGANTATRIGRGALAGTGAGLTYGFMEGEGGVENRVDNAKRTGILSGVIGGAIPAVGGATRAAGDRISQSRAWRRMVDNAPSTDDLREAASSLYDAAQQQGVSATPMQTGALIDSLSGILQQEGLVTPTGRISQAYPKVADALDLVSDYADEAMTPKQMQQVRKLLQGVAKSSDNNERRIGAAMLRQFDDFVEPLAPQFREANRIYHQASKGQMIDEAVELAGIRAGQFSGSGFENALRTEFRAMARKIAKGQLKGMTDDEVAMINRIASGGSMENLMRDLGKAAPRGVVSSGLTASVPFMIGNAFGGPWAGAALSAGALATGDLSRRLATAIQSKNAGVLGALTRSGGAMPAISDQSGRYGIGLLEALAQGGNPALAQRTPLAQ